MIKTICVDFDGVLHSYSSGWQGVATIVDDPVPGAIGWLVQMIDSGDYNVCIYSSRSSSNAGIKAMKDWLLRHFQEFLGSDSIKGRYYLNELDFSSKKPSAWLTIDDRAICFRGTFPSKTEIENFKPWNR